MNQPSIEHKLTLKDIHWPKRRSAQPLIFLRRHGLGFWPTLQFFLPQQGGHTPHVVVVVRPRNEDGDQQGMPMKGA